MLIDTDVVDFVAVFKMGRAVRRIGSGAGATTSWDAYMKLSRTVLRLRRDDVGGSSTGVGVRSLGFTGNAPRCTGWSAWPWQVRARAGPDRNQVQQSVVRRRCVAVPDLAVREWNRPIPLHCVQWLPHRR